MKIKIPQTWPTFVGLAAGSWVGAIIRPSVFAFDIAIGVSILCFAFFIRL